MLFMACFTIRCLSSEKLIQSLSDSFWCINWHSICQIDIWDFIEDRWYCVRFIISPAIILFPSYLNISVFPGLQPWFSFMLNFLRFFFFGISLISGSYVSLHYIKPAFQLTASFLRSEISLQAALVTSICITYSYYLNGIIMHKMENYDCDKHCADRECAGAAVVFALGGGAAARATVTILRCNTS